jgi:hypothetical protein
MAFGYLWQTLFALLSLTRTATGECLYDDLRAFNFTPVASDPNLIPTFCTNLFINGGNCIDLLAINKTFVASQAYLTDAAARAARMGRILQSLMNSTVTYKQVPLESGGGVDEPTFATNPSLDPFMVPNTTLFAINSTHYDGINRCLRDYFIITNGLWCFFTSNVTKEYTRTTDPTTPLSLSVDQNRTGTPLFNCLPLIDTYCVLSYGVSISFEGPPFGGTFSQSDGSLGIDLCRQLAAAFNSTDASSVARLQALLINNIVYTNWVPFIFENTFMDRLEQRLNGTFNGDWELLLVDNKAAMVANRSLGLKAHTQGTGEMVSVDGWVAVPVPVLVFYDAPILRTAAIFAFLCIFFDK